MPSLHYYRNVNRFRDEKGRFVSNSRGMKSSIARAEFEKKGEFIIAKREAALWEHEAMDYTTRAGASAKYLNKFFDDNPDMSPKQKDKYVRGLTLKTAFNQMKKHYPKITKAKHLYSKPSDLKRVDNKIATLHLIYQEGYGYSIIEVEHSRRDGFSSKGWSGWIEEWEDFIMKENVLPGIFSKHTQQWIYKEFIGWKWAD